MKKIIPIIVAVSLILIVLGMVFLLPKNNKKNNVSVKSEWKVSGKLKYDVCKNEDDCTIKRDIVYHKFSNNYKNDELQAAIKKLNNETDNYYKEDTTTSSCSENSEYKNNRISNLDYYVYDGDDYISLMYYRIIRNLCDNSQKATEVTNVIFSKKENKIITESEYRKREKITDEVIDKTIKDYIDIYNKTADEKIAIGDISEDNRIVYINNDGVASLLFKNNKENYYYLIPVLK